MLFNCFAKMVRSAHQGVSFRTTYSLLIDFSTTYQPLMRPDRLAYPFVRCSYFASFTCFLQPTLEPVAASGKLCGTSNRVCCNMTKREKTVTENKTGAESAAKKKMTKAEITAANAA